MDRAAHWENEWTRRLSSGTPEMNRQKFLRLVYEIGRREEHMGKKTLDVGCGPAIHAGFLQAICPEWTKNYVGIDLSKEAVQYARDHGIKAFWGDFFTTDPGKFECFWFLDSFEHFRDDEPLAERVKELATEHFSVLGNVPLVPEFKALDQGMERHVTIGTVHRFMVDLGMESYSWDVYGIHGRPFLFWEGSR